MAGITRQEEIRGIQKEYKWLYQLLGGIALLVLGIFLGIKIGEAEFYDRQRDYQMNLWTEAVGVIASIGLTVFILDRMSERRESIRQQEQLKRDLVRDAGSRVNQTAVNAVEQLRHKGWLTGDDSLLIGVNLYKASLEGAPLTEANLSYTNLERADLRNARMAAADLVEVHLVSAVLNGADLSWTNLQGAHVYAASLKDADLRNAKLKQAELMGSKMQRANLTGAYLQRADLRGALLTGADLEGAYLEGAKLEFANLQGACLPDGTTYSDDTDMGRFTDASHPEFVKTLAEVNSLRREFGIGFLFGFEA